MIRKLRKLTLWSPLLLLIFAGGCSQELHRGDLDTPNGADKRASEEVGLRFVLSTSTGDAVSFNRAAIQTESEYLIEQLDVYQFTGANGEETLEECYLDQSFTKVGDGASLVLKVKGTGEKKFVFVANNKGTGVVEELQALSKGITMTQFEKLVTESTDGVLLSSPLLMLGSTPMINIVEGVPAQRVQLKRIMARLDIKNYEPYLTLKRVRLKGVNDRGSIGADGVATGSKVINLPVVTIPTAVAPAGEDPAVVMEAVAEKLNSDGVVYEAAHIHYKHVYYPYASQEVVSEVDAPVLIIEGTLFEGDPERVHDVVYKKKLKLDGEDKFLGFKRNHRYTVAIEGGSIPGEADIKLYVNEWNLVELPIEEIEPMAPRVTKLVNPWDFYPGDYIFNEGDTEVLIYSGVIEDTGRLFVSKTWYFYVERDTDWGIYLKDGSLASEQITPWLRVKPNIMNYDANVIYNTTFPAAIEITYTEENNTGKDRSITFYLRSNVDPSKMTPFTVTQSAMSSLL